MDVAASRDIEAPPHQVSQIMFDPRHDPEWIGGARRVEAPTDVPTAIGARTTRHGGFMGKKFSWQTEVTRFEPDRLLDMHFVEGPMKGGSVGYRIEAEGAGSRVSIRNTAYAAPRIGLASLITIGIAGQVAMALWLDHFGALGLPREPINLGRILGALLVVAGVVMVRRS